MPARFLFCPFAFQSLPHLLPRRPSGRRRSPSGFAARPHRYRLHSPPHLPAAISSCAGRARRRMSNGSSDAPRYPAHQRAHRSHLRHRRPRSVPKVVRKVSKCLHLHTAEKIYPFDHNSQNQSFPRSWKWKENLLVFDVVQNRQTEICSGSHLRRLSSDAKYWSQKSVTCWR